MSHRILYSELQPCVLVACDCKEGEPFLMMFRSLTQAVTCAHCDQRYGLVNERGSIGVMPADKPAAAAKAN